MTPFSRVQHFFGKNAYFGIYKLKCINSTGPKQKQGPNARYGASLLTFQKKKSVFVYTVRQSLIDWPLPEGYFGSWDEFKAGVHVKALLSSLNACRLPISRSRFKRH